MGFYDYKKPKEVCCCNQGDGGLVRGGKVCGGLGNIIMNMGKGVCDGNFFLSWEWTRRIGVGEGG